MKNFIRIGLNLLVPILLIAASIFTFMRIGMIGFFAVWIGVCVCLLNGIQVFLQNKKVAYFQKFVWVKIGIFAIVFSFALL